MNRVKSLKDLKIGQVLVEITKDADLRIWEVLARDPKLNPDKELYWKYIYMLDSWGRVKVERWYESDLEIREVYAEYSYSKDLLLEKQIESLQSKLQHLLDLREKLKNRNLLEGVKNDTEN